MAVDGDVGLLVHAAAIEADMALDQDLDRQLDPDRDGVRTHGVGDPERPLVAVGPERVQALVQCPHAALAQVDLDHQARPQL